MSEVLQCATQKLKTWSFFNPAAPVLQTGHAEQRCNSHISGAIVLGGIVCQAFCHRVWGHRVWGSTGIGRSDCHRSLLFFHIIYIRQIFPVTSWNHAVNE